MVRDSNRHDQMKSALNFLWCECRQDAVNTLWLLLGCVFLVLFLYMSSTGFKGYFVQICEVRLTETTFSFRLSFFSSCGLRLSWSKCPFTWVRKLWIVCEFWSTGCLSVIILHTLIWGSWCGWTEAVLFLNEITVSPGQRCQLLWWTFRQGAGRMVCMCVSGAKPSPHCKWKIRKRDCQIPHRKCWRRCPLVVKEK